MALITVKLALWELQRLLFLMRDGPQQDCDRELYLKLIGAEERHEKKFR